jgi:hypothetical protein
MERSDALLLALILAAGVIVPGVLDYFLHQAGRPALGSAVWLAGFGTMILVVWYGWVRPLDFQGPDK